MPRPIDYSGVQSIEERFNKRYGVDFSYKEFGSSILSGKLLSNLFNSSMEDNTREERAYLDKFAALFKQALDNAVSKKIKNFSVEAMLDDYTNLMDGYRSACEESGEYFGDWPDRSELVSRAKKETKDLPAEKDDYIAKLYLDRKLRIRDMRAYAKELERTGENDPEKLSILLNYSRALEKVNATRPGWWRFFCYFKNKAEKREAANFKKAVTKVLKLYDLDAQKTDEYKENLKKTGARAQVELSKGFKEARDYSYETILTDVKDEVVGLSNAFNVARENRERAVDSGRTSVEVNDDFDVKSEVSIVIESEEKQRNIDDSRLSI